jgi:uncharacterized protein YegJ (DUF2314 family)
MPAKKSRSKPALEGRISTNFLWVDDDDRGMAAAIRRARRTIDVFLEALAHPKRGDRDFGIKALFATKTRREHLWVNDPTWDGRCFVGRLGNDPEIIRKLAAGDRCKVELARLSDWMFVRRSKLVGGETIRLLRKRMTPYERLIFDDEITFKID